MRHLVFFIFILQSILFCQSISFEKMISLPKTQPIVFDLAFSKDTVFMATGGGLLVFVESDTSMTLIHRKEADYDTSKSVGVYQNDLYLMIVNGNKVFVYEKDDDNFPLLFSYNHAQLLYPYKKVYPFGKYFIFHNYVTRELIEVTDKKLRKKFDLTIPNHLPLVNQDFLYPYAFVENGEYVSLYEYDGTTTFNLVQEMTDIDNVNNLAVNENYLAVQRAWGTSPPYNEKTIVYELELPNYRVKYDLGAPHYGWNLNMDVSNKYVYYDQEDVNIVSTLEGGGGGGGYLEEICITNNDYFMKNHSFYSRNGKNPAGILAPAKYEFSNSSNKLFELWRDSISIKQIEGEEFRRVTNFEIDYDKYLYSKDESIFVLQDSSVIRVDIVEDSVHQIYSLKLGEVKFYRELGNILIAQQQNNKVEIFNFDGTSGVKIYETDQIQQPLEAERIGDNIFILDYENEICKYDLTSGNMTIGWFDSEYSSKDMKKHGSHLIYCGKNKILLLDPLNDINPVLDVEQYDYRNTHTKRVISTGNDYCVFSKNINNRFLMVGFSIHDSEIIEKYKFLSEIDQMDDAAFSYPHIIVRDSSNFYWFLDSTVTSVKSIAEEIPTNFALHQNYPNPFNPTTKIKFVIPNVETGHAPSLQTKLVIYDILGKEVATLINKPMHPGSYEVEFDASNLSSGVYFYRLKSGEFSDTKKMVLLR